MSSVQPGQTVPSGEGMLHLDRYLQNKSDLQQVAHQTLMSWRLHRTTCLQVSWCRGGLELHSVPCLCPCHFRRNVNTSVLPCCSPPATWMAQSLETMALTP